MLKKIKGSKGVKPCFFVKNWKIWNCFFFSILGVDKVFGDVLKSKQSTLEEKNVHLWMAKKLIFSKRINQGFCQKMGKTSLEKMFGDVLYS